MDILELISYYLKRINDSKNKKLELKMIIKELDALINTGTKKHISNEDKLKILEGLQTRIISQQINTNEQTIINEKTTVFSQDNKELLELLEITMKEVQGK